MGLKISIDTNIFIDVKNKELTYDFSKRVLDLIDEGRLTAIISTIVVAEVCSGYHEAGELKEKDDFLTHILTSQNYEMVEISVGVADEAGRIRAITGLKLPDALLVASAMKRVAEYLITNDASVNRASKFIKVTTAKEFVKDLEGHKKQSR